MTDSAGTVQKRVTMEEFENDRWANLPRELLDIISKNLNIADYLRFGKVCRSWRLFFSECKQNFMASISPFILHISTEATNSCVFLELDSGVRYKTKLSEYFHNYNFCLGVSRGYLIMKNYVSCYFWIVNPVSGHEFKFYRTPRASDSIRFCRDRAVFASIGSEDEDFVLVILCDTKPDLELYTSRDNQWKDYSYTGKHWRILDIIVFDGGIYVVTIDNKIGIFNVRTLVVNFLNLESAPNLSWHVRLVVSYNQLFVVDFDPSCPVKVYRIDLSTMKWVEVNDLGNQALFIDKRSDRCFELKKCGGRSNCVYVLSCDECKIYPFNDAEHRTFPDWKWKFNTSTYSWYFVDTSNTIENIRDD